ncbi:MAG: hypothetical protein IH623_19575 [Verrucomicrobia bacterium]|nr:hypothetical protein [Verrucomicrobiota bacterium]
MDFIDKHSKASPSLPLGTVAEEFLATKEASGLRPRYVKTLRASIKRFLLGRRQKIIRSLRLDGDFYCLRQALNR